MKIFTHYLKMTEQLFHSRVNDVIPWQAKYPFPSQATKIHKQTTKFPPKNGGTFGSTGNGKVIRIEFPNDSYLNMLNSVLLFDMELKGAGYHAPRRHVLTVATALGVTTMILSAGGYDAIQATASYWKGGFIDIITGPARAGRVYQLLSYSSGGVITLNEDLVLPDGTYLVDVHQGVRWQSGGAQEMIQNVRFMYGGLVLEEIRDYNGLARIHVDAGMSASYKSNSGRLLGGTSAGSFRNDQISATSNVTEAGVEQRTRQALQLMDNRNSQKQRYALQLFTGLTSCRKLIPLKWMAAQFVMEITLADAQDCLIATQAYSTADGVLEYEVTNVNFLAELLDFDSTFDTAFFVGLKSTGVPIKFSSWHTHTFNITGSTITAQLMERARSVKSALARVQTTDKSIYYDTHRGYFDVNSQFAAPSGSTLNATQLNITGSTKNDVKQFQFRIGGKYYPAQPIDCQYGATEAYVEYLKTMDGLGDYTFSNDISPQQWHGITDSPSGGDKFTFATEFEHVDVFPDTISGLNAEEQSDMAMMVTWNGNGAVGQKVLQVYVAYDALIVIRDGNVVNLIL